MTEVVTNNTNYLAPFNNISDFDRKLFVGGLSWDITERDLLSYFGQYGSISNVKIKYNPQTGNSRGFGFVTFTSDGTIESVLENGPHSLKNRQIDLRKARNRPICKKIFVGGLCSNLDEHDIRSYFGKFGNIEGIELPYDRSRNRRREFCFVIFENVESADKACLESKQNVGGREVDIKKAQPNYQQQERRNYLNANNFTDGYNKNYRSDNRNNNYRQQNHLNNRQTRMPNYDIQLPMMDNKTLNRIPYISKNYDY